MRLSLSALVLALCPLPLLAQTVLATNNGVIRDNLCVGSGCSNTETFNIGVDDIKLKGTRPRFFFEDTDINPVNPGTQWMLQANGPDGSSDNRFLLTDITGGGTPFSVEGGAPENALRIAANGDVALGTSIPQADLHIVSNNFTTFRMEADGPVPMIYEAMLEGGAFKIRDRQASTAPFAINAGARNDTFVIRSDGVRVEGVPEPVPLTVLDAIGIGTRTPTTPLHIQRTGLAAPADPTAPSGILVDMSGTDSPRGLLTLRNSGQVFFALEDTTIAAGPNTGRQWNFQNLGGEFRVTTAPGGGADIEMRLDVDGNMRIEGNYFANSFTQMQVPDYVFEPEYALRPLSEVAAFVADNKHLPEVPPAAEIVADGVNLNEMQMTLLKKIEELTLYTLAQEKLIQRQGAELIATRADMAGLMQAHAVLAARIETVLDGR